jgi:single-stranded-DNA-specific exonuclease
MRSLRPKYRWRLRPAADVLPDSLAAAARLGLSERFVGMLSARGIASEDQLRAYVGAAKDGLHDPGLLPDAGIVVERIERARRNHERVLVFGDFDADGLTGLAIVTICLRRLGLDVLPYVPSRIEEGHGLSAAAVERARAEGRTLIVTVDCGTASVDEVELARRAGVDVIITDHHRLPSVLPDALALVNLQRPDSAYPDSRLAGSGVAFKVAQLLFGRARLDAALELADLAAIGTIADVAPILGENRALVRLGLDRIRTRPRPGVAALLDRARIDRERVDVDALGFQVAPRLNAAGRLGDAAVAARLLLSVDDAESAALASELEATNTTRRDVLATALDEARERAPADHSIGALVLAGPWPVGIVGLIAGRLAEERGVPTVVVSTAVSPWRGSARTANGFDVGAAFAACEDLFERSGGHSAAAGCSLHAERLDAFAARFLQLAGAPPVDRAPALEIDLALAPVDVDYRLYRELQALAPTGAGNPAPLVGVRDLVVTRARAVASGHAQVTVRKGVEVLDGIAFDRADLAEQLSEGDRIDVVASLGSRAFAGFESLQLEIRDAASAGHLESLVAAARGDAAHASGVARTAA